MGGLVAALMSPAGRIRRSADLAGVAVGMAVSLTMLPERPNILVLFLMIIAYGFVGFVSGSFLADIKSTDSTKSNAN